MTDPATRLSIHQYISSRLDYLSERQRTQTSSTAKDVLGGPDLALGENRFGMSSTPLLNISPNPDGSVDIQVKIRETLDLRASDVSDAKQQSPSDSPANDQGQSTPAGSSPVLGLSDGSH
jgi:hypothetical protein